MNEETIKKMIEIINKNILPVIIEKEANGDTMLFKYDKETHRYSVILNRVLEDGAIERKAKEALTIEELLPFINNPEFRCAIESFCAERTEKEKKYLTTKQQLIEELSSMEMSEETRKTMTAIIEKVSQLPEYVGEENRFELEKKDDYTEHLRLAGYRKWNEEGPELHLQLVQRITFGGTSDTNYPDLTLAQIVERVSEKGIVLESPESDKEIE